MGSEAHSYGGISVTVGWLGGWATHFGSCGVGWWHWSYSEVASFFAGEGDQVGRAGIYIGDERTYGEWGYEREPTDGTGRTTKGDLQGYS
jgi:hypothetical protein